MSFLTHESWHRSILKSLLSSPADYKELLLYSYKHVMHGFIARLTYSQLTEIEKSPAHLAIYPESLGKLLTTYSPKFLGLQQNFSIWPAASYGGVRYSHGYCRITPYGEDVIVGIIDTRIWPESESFHDEGMSPVPHRWKGKCENGTAFSPSTCNKKLIGARSFSKGLQAAGIKISKEQDFNSARDFYGHGTHTSSTAVGNHVHGVSYFGYARGIARGVAPGAHLAMYKVGWATDTELTLATDVLAGMEQAILDGVDIMSLSVGFNQTSYFKDIIAIGSLSAIDKGIFVVCSADNDFGFRTILNGAPWITTVGAGTLDWSFQATMTLENGISFEGISYFLESVLITDLHLYYGKGNMSKAICNHITLDRKEVARKVVCDYSTKIEVSQQMMEVERVGAYAAIFLTDISFSLSLKEYSIPGILLPTASGTLHAPQVANFSSKGPSPISPGVLKPDILAPGVDVLAAFVPSKPIIQVGKYYLASDYALESSTSMSTPHVVGIGALLKAVHPEWSPAAIRSAM
uniref:Peptidase S8/S53 domain-containing protein n=1 Tax=Fagus sylvatica TaxID=28930 RepID=A0A2N9FUT2_FAGSY